MIHHINIPTKIVEKTFELAVSKPVHIRGDFFHEIRLAFKKQLEDIFITNGIEVYSHNPPGQINYLKNGKIFKMKPITKHTGCNKREELVLEFCAKYGHNDYSLTAVNYIDRTLCALPSLYPFSQSGLFSIGNILILVGNDDYDLELSFNKGINLTGYSYHISKRKKKSYVCLFGVWFDNEILSPIVDKLKKTTTCKNDLDEIRIGIISYPMMSIDRLTGNLFTCSCFNGYFDFDDDIIRLLPYGNSEKELIERVSQIKIMEGICHLCNGGVPKNEYGHCMYYSTFMKRYLPYHILLSRKKYQRNIYEGDIYKEVENESREMFGYPKIGEKWISETTLFKVVCTLFPNIEIIHHYRGNELNGLELDIWIPGYKVGIEYQGEQHYKEIEPWGGEDGLKKRMEKDKMKKRLCKKLGYQLIEFKYTEELTEDSVKRKLSRFLDRQFI
jgi:hypothetical protein